MYANYSPEELVAALLCTDNPYELKAIQRALDNARRGAYDRRDDFMDEWS